MERKSHPRTRTTTPSGAWLFGLVAMLVTVTGCAMNLEQHASLGNAAQVRAMLEKGADANASYLGTSPLEAAAQYGHYDIVKLLLEHGADPTRGNVLALAIGSGRQDIVELLRTARAAHVAPSAGSPAAQQVLAGQPGAPPQGSLVWAAACARGAHLWLDSQGRPAQMDALLAPSTSCQTRMRNAPAQTANQVAQCFLQQSTLACATEIGGPAAFADPLPVVSGTAASSGQVSDEVLGWCAYGASLWLESQGVSPKLTAALNAPRAACVAKMQAASPDVVSKIVQCFARYQLADRMDCLSPIGGRAAFDVPPGLAATLPTESCDPGDEQLPDCVHFRPAESDSRGLALQVYRVLAGRKHDISSDLKSEMDRASATCTSAEACQTACTASDQSACALIGYRYWQADGVPKAEAKGTKVIRDACAAGSKLACSMVTFFGVQAATCSDDAGCTSYCNRGLFPACRSLGGLAVRGLNVPKDPIRGVRLLNKACDGGDAEGCGMLGLFYWRGEGVAANHSLAQALTQKSCTGGFAAACDTLKEMTCVNSSLAPGKRRPSLDAVCQRTAKNRSKKVYYTAYAKNAQEEGFCENVMRAQQCYGIYSNGTVPTQFDSNTDLYCCQQVLP